jgi:hypothetical protein
VGARDPRLTPSRALLAFAASVFTFHHLPTLVGGDAGSTVDLVTPLAVVGAAAAALATLAPGRAALALALVAGVLYVDGHGLHLAANSIRNEGPTGDVERVAEFWDETFSHAEWHLGWFALVAALCVAAREPVRLPRLVAVAFALLLGWSVFTSTVEGRTWPRALAPAPAFAAWASARRHPVLVASAAAFALAALLVGVWAALHGGEVPEFSDVGLL